VHGEIPGAFKTPGGAWRIPAGWVYIMRQIRQLG